MTSQFPKQQTLPIDTYAEAKRKKTFIPKPRLRDVHRSLRTFRNLICLANEHGALNFMQIQELVECLTIFVNLQDEDFKKAELKKLLYVVMKDKKVAETLDGSVGQLFERSMFETFNHLPRRFSTFQNTDIGDLAQAYKEIWQELDPVDESGLSESFNDGEKRERIKQDIKKRFPALYRIEWGK